MVTFPAWCDCVDAFDVCLFETACDQTQSHSGAALLLLRHSVCGQSVRYVSLRFLCRQVVFQHPLQLRGHAGDHTALRRGSRGRAWTTGGCTALPQWVSVSRTDELGTNLFALCCSQLI